MQAHRPILRSPRRVDNATPNVGDTVTFTITLGNNGPDDSTGAEVTDALPAGLTLLIATASQGTYDGASGIWTVGGDRQRRERDADAHRQRRRLPARSRTSRRSPARTKTIRRKRNNQSGAAVNGQLADIGVLKTVDNAESERRRHA